MLVQEGYSTARLDNLEDVREFGDPVMDAAFQCFSGLAAGLLGMGRTTPARKQTLGTDHPFGRGLRVPPHQHRKARQ